MIEIYRFLNEFVQVSLACEILLRWNFGRLKWNCDEILHLRLLVEIDLCFPELKNGFAFKMYFQNASQSFAESRIWP